MIFNNMNGLKTVKAYTGEIRRALDSADKSIGIVVAVLKQVLASHGKIWCLGNGGSMAIAQHFAQDLVKMKGIQAQCINCPSILTAYTNDDGFENCFEMPLSVLASSSDAVVIFSCSGKSLNYKRVLENKANTKLISIVGTDGGFLKNGSDAVVHVNSNDYQICEAAFQIIADLIIKNLEI